MRKFVISAVVAVVALVIVVIEIIWLRKNFKKF